ncbi:hypothetical protein HNY73_004559 [Argiope bruennichi]|uniref:Uncharacterized protein n=1 Tax=Argiope bruennichi TaxID=94029 RepID=A0A8T0FU28_ARGBR|nr:hypothetical protein HNY73_004559 [Argiope bruennichi]
MPRLEEVSLGVGARPRRPLFDFMVQWNALSDLRGGFRRFGKIFDRSCLRIYRTTSPRVKGGEICSFTKAANTLARNLDPPNLSHVDIEMFLTRGHPCLKMNFYDGELAKKEMKVLSRTEIDFYIKTQYMYHIQYISF